MLFTHISVINSLAAFLLSTKLPSLPRFNTASKFEEVSFTGTQRRTNHVDLSLYRTGSFMYLYKCYCSYFQTPLRAARLLMPWGSPVLLRQHFATGVAEGLR